MAHFINVTCAVLLGPWYAFLCALAIGLIRMAFMGIPPLALTGAVFAAAVRFSQATQNFTQDLYRFVMWQAP